MSGSVSTAASDAKRHTVHTPTSADMPLISRMHNACGPLMAAYDECAARFGERACLEERKKRNACLVSNVPVFRDVSAACASQLLRFHACVRAATNAHDIPAANNTTMVVSPATRTDLDTAECGKRTRELSACIATRVRPEDHMGWVVVDIIRQTDWSHLDAAVVAAGGTPAMHVKVDTVPLPRK
ncbi:hypothetical protein H9P43_007201 [Blastocladiella emersonii ATCC 22665]|nr:hypothetical protein H9P43_007201 [Blastocladiella emersonii ATCC 22665]